MEAEEGVSTLTLRLTPEKNSIHELMFSAEFLSHTSSMTP